MFANARAKAFAQSQYIYMHIYVCERESAEPMYICINGYFGLKVDEI